MTQIQDTPGKKTKKEFRKEIITKLSAALAEFKNGIPDEKFNEAVKKAGKMLSRELRQKNKKEKKIKKKKSKPAEDVLA